MDPKTIPRIYDPPGFNKPLSLVRYYPVPYARYIKRNGRWDSTSPGEMELNAPEKPVVPYYLR